MFSPKLCLKMDNMHILFDVCSGMVTVSVFNCLFRIFLFTIHIVQFQTRTVGQLKAIWHQSTASSLNDSQKEYTLSKLAWPSKCCPVPVSRVKQSRNKKKWDRSHYSYIPHVIQATGTGQYFDIYGNYGNHSILETAKCLGRGVQDWAHQHQWIHGSKKFGDEWDLQQISFSVCDRELRFSRSHLSQCYIF